MIAKLIGAVRLFDVKCSHIYRCNCGETLFKVLLNLSLLPSTACGLYSVFIEHNFWGKNLKGLRIYYWRFLETLSFILLPLNFVSEIKGVFLKKKLISTRSHASSNFLNPHEHNLTWLRLWNCFKVHFIFKENSALGCKSLSLVQL